jgi:hypothetical protein
VAERNALQEHVFPRPRELCQRYAARFHAIDLRCTSDQDRSRSDTNKG